jgi:hypothetical protein
MSARWVDLWVEYLFESKNILPLSGWADIPGRNRTGGNSDYCMQLYIYYMKLYTISIRV